MREGQRHQKIVALYVLKNSQNRELRLRLAREQLHETDPELQYWVLMNCCYQYYPLWRKPGTEADGPTITFEQVEALKDTGSLRQSTIGLLLSQPEEILKFSLTRLLSAKNELQRLGGLEVLTEVKSDASRQEQFGRLQPLTRADR